MSVVYEGLDHVQIAAPKGSEPEARRFYGEWLGLSEIPKPENLKKRGGVWFACGRHELHIGVQDDFVPAKKAHPAFAVVGLDTLRERLLAHGVTPVEDEPIPGVRRFHVFDPFGNRLEFVERG